MRGYLSFILVFVSVLLLLYLLELQLVSNSFEFGKAIVVHRTYSIQMNVKEAFLELARQGAVDGFEGYDSSHSIALCKHCADYSCIPGSPSNNCDILLCNQCFREREARHSAENSVVSKLQLVGVHVFDPDFNVSTNDGEPSAYLRAEPLSKNGFSLDYVKFKDDISIVVGSDKFGISSKSKIPRGCVIYAEGPGFC